MTDAPGATPVATPVVGTTVATPVVADDQVEDVVTFLVEPSLKVAVAVNCCVPPIGTEAVAGVTAMDTKPGGARIAPCPPPPPPHPAAKAANSNAVNHISGLVTLANLFILFPFYLILKSIGAIHRIPLLLVCYVISAADLISEFTNLSPLQFKIESTETKAI